MEGKAVVLQAAQETIPNYDVADKLRASALVTVWSWKGGVLANTTTKHISKGSKDQKIKNKTHKK